MIQEEIDDNNLNNEIVKLELEMFKDLTYLKPQMKKALSDSFLKWYYEGNSNSSADLRMVVEIIGEEVIVVNNTDFDIIPKRHEVKVGDYVIICDEESNWNKKDNLYLIIDKEVLDTPKKELRLMMEGFWNSYNFDNNVLNLNKWFEIYRTEERLTNELMNRVIAEGKEEEDKRRNSSEPNDEPNEPKVDWKTTGCYEFSYGMKIQTNTIINGNQTITADKDFKEWVTYETLQEENHAHDIPKLTAELLRNSLVDVKVTYIINGKTIVVSKRNGKYYLDETKIPANKISMVLGGKVLASNELYKLSQQKLNLLENNSIKINHRGNQLLDVAVDFEFITQDMVKITLFGFESVVKWEKVKAVFYGSSRSFSYWGLSWDKIYGLFKGVISKQVFLDKLKLCAMTQKLGGQ